MIMAGSLALLEKEKGNKLAIEQDRMGLQLLEEIVWLVQT